MGQSAWADTKTLYPTGATDPTSTGLWLKHDHVTATQNSTDKYISFTHSQNGTRCFYLNFYTTGSDFYSTYDTYTVSFDFWNTNAWSNGNSSSAELIMYGEGASFPSPLYSLFTGANTSKKNYLFHLGGSGTWIKSFYVNGATENPVSFTKQNWYTVSITVTKSTGSVSYSITPQGSSTPLTNGSGSFTTSSSETNLNCQGLFFTLGKGGYETRIANVKVTTEVTGDNADAPSLALTGFLGTSRIFQISCNDGETIHYQVKDGDEVKQSGNGASAGASVNVTVPAGQKLIAYTTKGLATSSNTEITVTGGDVALTAPVVTLTNIDEGYEKSYKISGLTQTITEGSYSYNFEPTGIFYSTLSTATSGTDISDNAFTLTEKGTYYVILSKDGTTSSYASVDNNTPYAIINTYDFGSTDVLVGASWNDASGTEKWVNSGTAEAYKENDNTDKSTTSLFNGFTVSDNGQRLNKIHWHSGKGIQFNNGSGNFTIGLTSVPTGAIVKNHYIQNGSNRTEIGNTVTIGRYNVTTEKQALTSIEVFIPAVIKNISAAGWATYCSPYALDFSSAIANLDDAYIVTGGEGGVLSKTSVSGSTVPANTGLLLKGIAGTVTIPVVASSSTDVSANKLVGVTTDTPLAAEAGYVLMASPSLAFYKNSNAFTVGANTAYLPVGFATDAAPAFFSLDFDGEATGISEIKTMRNAGNEIFFDLQGRKVAQPSKGLYIVNGKKVVIK